MSASPPNSVFLAVPGWGTAATLYPQAGGSVSVTGIICDPAMEEGFLPGSSQGVSTVRLFVDYANVSPAPQHGDKAQINGTYYDVGEVNVDRNGGAVLKLKKRQGA